VSEHRFWRDECGVFGVHGPGQDVSRLTYFGLFALQHRGQESAGIAVTDGADISCSTGMGLVSLVFVEERLAELQGIAALGHVRYSTTGSSVEANAQPILVNSEFGPLAIAHNGNIVNAWELRQELEAQGVLFTSSSDSEVIARLVAANLERGILGAIETTMARAQGAYSLGLLFEDKLIGVRDPWGVRPLCLGRINDRTLVLASESCALAVVGAQLEREVEPGEVVFLSSAGVEPHQPFQEETPALCIFEYVYLARPDSLLYGKTVYDVRRRMGHLLAREHPAEADVVVPVPLTGIPIALGYSEASGTHFTEGFIMNRYVQRTFIQPDQRMRELGVRMKFSPLAHNVAGRRVVMVEDSIVRGTSTMQLVRMLRDAGARQVHVRIASPPIRYPCFYGIDTPDPARLVASHMSVEEIRRLIGADSLGYLSLDSLVEAVGLPKRVFCHACFTGKYPIQLPARTKITKAILETGVTP